ncbi:MAG: methionyl-tRNA formyltransferase [Lachnospiraceae bacterium]|nr:methionyl-tRNA formyltransferase [Lachnospiraceae bacterium]
MKIIVATIKSWNIERARALQEKYAGVHEIVVYTKKEEFTPEAVSEFAPDYILMPHWSYILSDEITKNWNCVVFHMTDLPYGRGGSPLQNLIVRGHKETMISAIKVTEKLDGGPVYMKKPLSLAGSAQEIFVRCSDIIFNEMIPIFLEKCLEPVEQKGEPVVFKRRTEKDGEITSDMKIEKIYDYIRMLDAEGYPRAFMDFGEYRLCFENASLSENGESVEARVVFRKRSES